MIVFDTKGGLHKGRDDIKADTAFYRKWELCEQTNPDKSTTSREAMKGADVLIALSQPGPDTVKPDWISSMGHEVDRLRLRQPGARDLSRTPPRKRAPTSWPPAAATSPTR